MSEKRFLRGWCIICAGAFFLGDIMSLITEGDNNYDLVQIGVILMVGYGIMAHMAKEEE